MNKADNYYMNKEALTELLLKLIEIPSTYFNEKDIMDFVFQWLKERELNPVYHYYEETKVTKFKGVNVIGRLKGDGEGPSIYLNGHVDTVYPCKGWDSDPFKGRIEEDKLYGLGALDMKSGVAAIMLALEAFKKSHNTFKGEIIYSFVSDEEGPYGLGTNAVIEDGIAENADVAIVAEPSSGFCSEDFPCICLGARGGYNYIVTVSGKSAHAANPEKGINAVLDSAKIMVELETSSLYEDEKLGKGSICILSSSSESQACSVPDTASFTVFRHVVNGEDAEYVKNELIQAAKRAKVSSKVEFQLREAPSEATGGFMPYTVDENNEYVKAFISSVEKCCDKKPSISYFKSIGDFNYIGSRLKIPTIIFGPSGKNYHTANEYVDVNSLIGTSLAIYNFLHDTLS